MRNVPILLAALAWLALAAPMGAHAAGANLPVGDLNGDGHPDLHASGPTPVSGHPPPKNSVAVADVNGDGRLDLHAGGPTGGSSTGSAFKTCAMGQHVPNGVTTCTADGNHAAPVGAGGTHVVH